MTYRRRYFSVLEVPTESIKDNAITEDKIASGAVASDEIEDGTIQGQDVKDGAITAPKLANNSVSTEKIQDGAVTAGKMSVAILTRPLVPGVDTPEIADGKVTAAKLAAGTFTTDKIADGAVTTVKIAGSAVDNTKIAADAVRGTEIQNGAVSVNKLGTDAVETVKIKDDNVTTPKLADEAVTNVKIDQETLRKFLKDYALLYDEFDGAALNNRWGESGDGGGSAAMGAEGKVTLATAGGLNDQYRINFNGVKSLRIERLPRMSWGVRLPAITTENVEFGLIVDATHYLIFRYDSSVDGNWHAISCNGGAEEDTDTGIAADASSHLFDIEYIALDDVKFYIDDVLKATHTTENPTTGTCEPQAQVEALAVAVKSVELYFVAVKDTRPI